MRRTGSGQGAGEGMRVTVDDFIERWGKNEGGAERANFPLFLTELCALLDLPQPDPADATLDHNDYVFERAAAFRDAEGKIGTAASTCTSADRSCWRRSRADRRVDRRK